MAVNTAISRTKKNGVLEIVDAAGANNIITVTLTEGDLSADLLNKVYEPVRDRGVISHFIAGDDQTYQGSLTFHVTEFVGSGAITDFDDMTPWQVILQTNLATITSTGAAGETKLVNMRLRLTDPDGVGDEEITWARCVFTTAQIAEGYPTKATLNFMARTAPAIVYSAT